MVLRLFPHPKVKLLTLSIDWLVAAIKVISVLRMCLEFILFFFSSVNFVHS
jgi:hypothetical protein